MQEHECYKFNVSFPTVSRIRALSACHRFSCLDSRFCSVLRASSAPSSSPPPLTVSHRCSRVGQEALASSRMLQLPPCGTSRWPLGTKFEKSLAGTVLLPPTNALSPSHAIVARRGVGGAPLPCAKHVSSAVSAIAGRCSAASRTGLCPCTQRLVRHRDPGRVDACIVPPPPTLPECRAAAPLHKVALIFAN